MRDNFLSAGVVAFLGAALVYGYGCSDGGETGGGGAGGAANGACNFDIDASLSSAIPTVGVVTWSVGLTSVDEAHIDFGLTEGGPMWTAPVDLDQPTHRTLLLGMKAERTYAFRIVATAGGVTCTSDDQTLTTGALPATLPAISVSTPLPDQVTPGFIVTSAGIQTAGGTSGAGGGFPGTGGGFPGTGGGFPGTGGGFPGTGGGFPGTGGGFPGTGGGGPGSGGAGSSSPVVILDSDGDIVWFADAPASTSRARMSWEADAMWMMALNVAAGMGGGHMRRVSMDGLDVENVDELSDGHHDFTVLPEGLVAVIVHTSTCSAVVERAPNGTVTTVVDDVSTLYTPAGDCHPNSILYHPVDDSYTVGDRNPNLFVKITRDGQLLWQFGGSDPHGDFFAGTWEVNHGHQILDNGNFLFYNNGLGPSASSKIIEYSLDESTWTATSAWTYDAQASSNTLGDVQRLPSGNTLVAVSNAGILREVDSSGATVQEITSTSFGYADFRTSLYGPPLR